MAVLLAAGKSRRYGENKITAAELNGVAIGLLAAKTYQACLPTLAVVKAGDAQAKKMFEDAGLHVVTAHQAHLGMGNSLAAGVSEACARGATHCLIGLADMPLVKHSTLEVLLAALVADEDVIVRPSYNGVFGNPVGFGKKYFAELMRLSEDQGAKALLVKYASSVIAIDVSDRGVVYDVDTPTDLTQAS